MNVQSFIPFTPFLALLYLAYALIQSLRKKRQGIFAALLALIALALPLAGLILAQDSATRSSLVNYLTLNGIIVFVGSLFVLMIERRNPARANRSYGILGIAVAALIAVEIFVYPLLPTAQANNAAGARADNSTLENISATSTQVSAFGKLLAIQTGLTVEALSTQLQAGSTIADLVAKNKGDLDAVTKAAASALDDLVSKGGASAQIISRLGTDTTAIAIQFEQGQLQTRAQGLLTTVLLTGTMPSFQGRQNGAGANGTGGATGNNTGAAANTGAGGNGGAGGNNGAAGGTGGQGNNAAAGDTGAPAAESTDQAASAGSGNGGTANNTGTGRPGRNNGTPAAPADPNGSQIALQPTAQATSIPATPTVPVIRPTVISFPTLESTSDDTVAAAESTAESTAAADPSTAGTAQTTADGSATCTITPIYNLNLRDKPATDGTIYLSIPFSTNVVANGRTADNWYSVTYNAKTGWVSGEYVATDGSCDKLPLVKVS